MREFLKGFIQSSLIAGSFALSLAFATYAAADDPGVGNPILCSAPASSTLQCHTRTSTCPAWAIICSGQNDQNGVFSHCECL